MKVFDAEAMWKWSSGRHWVWFSLTPTARFARASPPQLFRVWREAALVQQMALKRADFVRAFRSPGDAWILGYFPDTWFFSIQDTHTCTLLYPVFRSRLRIQAFEKNRSA